MAVDPREIIRRTEHTVIKNITVSRNDVLARYKRSDLKFTGRSPEGDAIPAVFKPTHRVCLIPEGGGAPLAFDFVTLLEGRGPIVDLFEPANENFMCVVSINDLQWSNMGLHVVREPSYLHDPERQVWWRYKMDCPEWTSAQPHIATIDYLEDGPRQNLNLSFKHPTGYVYFLQEDRPNGAIKVGFSRDSQKRLQAHQTSNSVKLKLLVDVPGAFEDETMLHHIFKEHRTGGGEEWFEAEPVMKWLQKQFLVP